MKNLLIITGILLTAISCNQTEVKNETKFKFFHADTNAELRSADVILKAMQMNKVYRLEVKTGECYNYTTNK